MIEIDVADVRPKTLPRAWSDRVFNLLISASIGAVFAGAVAWLAFQSTNTFNAHATIAGNQAEIVALQEQQRSIDTQLSNFSSQYVSQPSFAEFKSRYDKDQAEEHDFRMRIDTKMDILLSEHTAKPQQ